MPLNRLQRRVRRPVEDNRGSRGVLDECLDQVFELSGELLAAATTNAKANTDRSPVDALEVVDQDLVINLGADERVPGVVSGL